MEDYREQPWQQELRANVNRGVEFLDDESPGWFKLIEAQTLVMDSMYSCVCGSVFRSIAHDLAIDTGFEYFTQHYTLQPIEYGFDCPSDDSDEQSREYGYLAELWIEAANKKLANEGLVF